MTTQLNQMFELDGMAETITDKASVVIQQENSNLEGFVLVLRDKVNSQINVVGNMVSVMNMAQDIVERCIRNVVEEFPEEVQEDLDKSMRLQFTQFLLKRGLEND